MSRNQCCCHLSPRCVFSPLILIPKCLNKMKTCSQADLDLNSPPSKILGTLSDLSPLHNLIFKNEIHVWREIKYDPAQKMLSGCKSEDYMGAGGSQGVFCFVLFF